MSCKFNFSVSHTAVYARKLASLFLQMGDFGQSGDRPSQTGSGVVPATVTLQDMMTANSGGGASRKTPPAKPPKRSTLSMYQGVVDPADEYTQQVSSEIA